MRKKLTYETIIKEVYYKSINYYILINTYLVTLIIKEVFGFMFKVMNREKMWTTPYVDTSNRIKKVSYTRNLVMKKNEYEETKRSTGSKVTTSNSKFGNGCMNE
jgi:hypothetical protein